MSEHVKAQVSPRELSVEVSAETRPSPPEIRLVWPGDSKASRFLVRRKLVAENSWGEQIILPGSSTNYLDSAVAVGTAYEYQIIKERNDGVIGYGYIASGMQLPLVEHRGTVILVIENRFASDLAFELKRLELDLIGDGWQVVRHEVAKEDPVTKVKSLIQADYAADPQNVRAVFLFGRVPVPYSGNIAPDGHTPDHEGAWPADLYYGEMDGQWTDTEVTNQKALKQRNWNVPGDGKFDQNEPPSEVELQVGRVDFWNMTNFENKVLARSEKDLLRQYLNKDHHFRHTVVRAERRALLMDMFGLRNGAELSGSGWRSFSAFFGSTNLTQVWSWYFLPTLSHGSYLCSYATSGGSYYYLNGLGTADDFAMADPKTVFTMLLGSYFGDWDNESNFLRSLLGTTSHTLTCTYSGYPHSFFHHMALGETVGHAIRLSQNNDTNQLYRPYNQGTHQVHIALLGDPTLRLHPVEPPGAIECEVNSGRVKLSWAGSNDPSLIGYYVYRSLSPQGRFARVSGAAPLAITSLSDTPGDGQFTYMVKAIKLESSASGNYFNSSQGKFATVTLSNGLANPSLSAPTQLAATPLSTSEIELRWTRPAGSIASTAVERRLANGLFSWVAEMPADITRFIDRSLNPSSEYFYRLRMRSASAESHLSTEVSTRTLSPTRQASVVFLGTDPNTRGNWNGTYGNDGFAIAADVERAPPYAQVETFRNTGYSWTGDTTDARALRRYVLPNRIASAWYTQTNLFFQIRVRDNRWRRLAVYLLDWDRGERIQDLAILDGKTGELLHELNVTDFDEGIYYLWSFRGELTLRVTARTRNALVSGLFFDSIPETPPPTLSPSGGTFYGHASVTLGSDTSAAVIYYTMNGTDPTENSARYEGPIRVSRTSTLKAIAIAPGLNASAVVAQEFKILPMVEPKAVFLREDWATKGDWVDRYGGSGFQIMAGTTQLPAPVSADFSGVSTYIWQTTTAESRAPLKSNSTTERTAACWYGDHFSFGLMFLDGLMHQVSLYCLDWDRNQRVQRVEILKADSDEVLSSLTLREFADGKFLVWNVQGIVKFRFTRLEGNNALVSGIFFDPQGELPRTQWDSKSIQWNSSGLSLQIAGPTGRAFVIEASTNLADWLPVATNWFSNGPYEFLDRQGPTVPRRFYRTVILP
ncbi:MAG: chitobiase/beta-hexosaminidase C-terminal domain-containing protein [Verrucomicrobiota bacterium]